ncbi:Fic family protein [Mesorhizobium sp. M0146]|uniref:Fic family protein n=1 Tax=unclassified Mesorhizobium TaxID=325217 RepID=UPI003338EAB2
MLRSEPDCPKNWEYKDVPSSDGLLARRSVSFLTTVRGLNPSQKASLSKDLRPLHGALFRTLTPPHFLYFAGHYRGEAYRCLLMYTVGISGDKRVGHPPGTVPMEMEKFALDIARIISDMDLTFQAPSAWFSPEEKLLRAIQLVAALFVYFLEIHPFANGNGHMARMLIICLLGRHDLYLKKDWPLHPRPSEPAYSRAIMDYRNGNRSSLHVLLLQCL